jgi:tyrosine-protein kinase Etk/Wzc
LLRLLQVDAVPGSTFVLARNSKWQAVAALGGALSVSERGRDTGVLSLTLEGENPERIKQTLRAIARTYLLQNIERRSAEAQKSLGFLEQQLPKIRTELDLAERKLNNYRTKSESVDLSLETESILKQQVDLETRLSDLQFKESELRRLYTPQHPSYRALLQQRATMEAGRKRLERQVQELPQTQQEILRLARDVETNQAIYVQLINKSQELEILKAGTVGNVRIIDDALVAPKPVKPRARLVLALSALLGLMAGVAGIFIAAAMKQTIESPEQLEEEGIPVYAALPRSTSQEQLEKQGAVRKRKGLDKVERKPLLAYSHPGDVTVEALRSLRTSLHFAMLGAGNKVVMITGPSPGIGKSFITANLGVVLAQAGKKVMIIDGDLRKGRLHTYFGALPQNGLSNYLAGDQSTGLARRTSVQGLDFIPRGEVPPNPSELLLQPRLKALLQKLSEKYDYILIDSPPVLAVTDAAILGEAAGTTLLVVRFGVNTVREMNLCRRRLERNGVVVKGCIFNALERRASNTYGYYAYYNYKYGDGPRGRPGTEREVVAQADAVVGLESGADTAEKV